ncbi:Rrf2 family transcriptional regulator [bacterium]|nr:Rrf2 family transcriptional regulator [bacterium]MBU1025436.1 Rrf2 family transcriptional regulator [bacterium]
MFLSKKSIYALRVLRHLSNAHGGKSLSASYLAEREQISLKYLEQILSDLRKSGFLVSERGKDGGYTLRIPPGEITLGQIIRAIDGPLAPIPCASRTAPTKKCDCPNPMKTCWLREIMLRVRDNISEVIDNETLLKISSSLKQE